MHNPATGKRKEAKDTSLTHSPSAPMKQALGRNHTEPFAPFLLPFPE